MELVAARCPSCNGDIQLDPGREAGFCLHCGTKVLVSEAVRQYNVTNNITAGVVNVIGASRDFEIRAGVLVKYHGAATDVVVPDGVVEIGREAFLNMGVKSVIIPDGVTIIGNSAFNMCSRLTSVKLPSSLLSIEPYAFSNCESLSSIIIPDGVTKIGFDAFRYCKKLIDVKLPDSLRSIEDRAFLECRSLRSVIIPEAIVAIGEQPFYYSIDIILQGKCETCGAKKFRYDTSFWKGPHYVCQNCKNKKFFESRL